ncbi:MAG: NmrA/HSCARG family protein [Gemmatimonadota bacterium]|nr:NmrA/HSCARG family protein [Gemmatimonadota bacterium]MDH5197789.1 NmrA/HSCARG family protein [Gemmatimonadota bacterium]
MQKGKDIIVVTGATGQQGGATARELLAAGHRVRAMTRNPASDAAKALAKLGAEVVQGDLDDPASLKKAFAGAWGVFAVQNTWEAGVEQEEVQGKRTAEVAKAAGVQHFVYASVGSAHRNTGIPHFDNKARVETKVRELGFPSYVILRPAFFMENLTSPWFKPYIDEGNLAVGIKPDTKLQMIAVTDIGKYGRIAFEKHAELNGQAIDIAGDELTMPQTAEIIGKAAGRSVAHFQVPIEEVRKFSEDFALMLEWFDAKGYEANIAGNAKTYGVAPTSFTDWATAAAW